MSSHPLLVIFSGPNDPLQRSVNMNHFTESFTEPLEAWGVLAPTLQLQKPMQKHFDERCYAS